MAIIRRSETRPARGGLDPFEMMREMLNLEPFRDLGQWTGQEGRFVPSFEIKETKDAFLFKADLPGVKEEDVEVSVHGNRLTVSGKREAEKQDEGDTWYAFERSYGTFTRSFTLPNETDAEHCDAHLENGVLTLRLPKREEAKAKRIDVRAKGGGGKKEIKA